MNDSLIHWFIERFVNKQQMHLQQLGIGELYGQKAKESVGRDDHFALVVDQSCHFMLTSEQIKTETWRKLEMNMITRMNAYV